jgi:hypothetical protein
MGFGHQWLLGAGLQGQAARADCRLQSRSKFGIAAHGSHSAGLPG